MNSFVNEKLEQITSTALNGFNEETIRQHWDTIIGFKQLQPDETVRLVIMPSKDSNMAKSGNIATGGWADKVQIRSAEDLINRMTELQGTEIPGMIGYALSAGIYQYVPDKSPNFTTLKYIQNMIIDVDAHKNETTKDRFNLTTIKPEYLEYAAVAVLNYINELVIHNGLPYITPLYTAMTGGGFQFGVRFDKTLNKDDGKKVFETFGSILGFNYLNKKDDPNFAKEQEINNKALENTSIELSAQGMAALGDNGPGISLSSELQEIKKKKGIKVHLKSFTDDWYAPFLELDNSFKDVTHAQRIPGTINQKYEAFAYIDNDLIPGLNYDQTIQKLVDDINRDLSIVNDKDRFNITDKFRQSNTYLKTSILANNPNKIFTKQPTDLVKNLSPIIQFANSESRSLVGDYISLTEVEKQILAQLSSKELVLDVLGDMGIEVVKDSGNYIACRSPFRTDSKPSLAVYLNGPRASIKEFTEDKNYNLITLWMAVFECNKTAAIDQLALKYNISIDKTDKREFQKLQTTESVIDFIKKVNTVDFVYYRLANASKNCIYKSVKTGKSHSFDGYKMLADHVLRFQLKVKNADEEFKKAFQEAFLQYVMIDAFEDFLPGGDRVYEDEFIQFVNIWTASDGYLKCWEEAASLSDMNIDEALSLIKEVCPHTYVFLLQITQKGDLKYFLNWLNAISKFQYLPIVPIFPSIEGAGKNLFSNQVLAPYVNKNYITVANGQAMQSNFNSFMGHSNLIIADEGDFTGSRDFDQLKLLTGNDTVRVEKKGVDAQVMARRFNICMFTNGTEPVRHSVTDRRCVYFKLEHTLQATLTKLGYASVDEFNEKVDSEIYKFWGIIIKTKLHKPWMMNNIKNGQYYYQILMMHPFGKLVLKIIENKWDEISLQLNERQRELQEEKINMQLLQNIETAFFNGEALPLITINKYLDAMSWKSSTSIQEFINKNKLQDHGISIIVEQDSIKIKLDAEKLQKLIYQENNLAELIPEFSIGKPKNLEELKEAMLQKRNPKLNVKLNSNTPSSVNIHTESKENPFKGPGSESFAMVVNPVIPGMSKMGTMVPIPGSGLPGLPSGI